MIHYLFVSIVCEKLLTVAVDIRLEDETVIMNVVLFLFRSSGHHAARVYMDVLTLAFAKLM